VEDAPNAPPATRKVAVFIADDSPIVCDRLAAMLGELRHVVLVGQAGTVPEAISAIGALRPAVVILDIHMPGGSGFDVLRAVKRDAPATVVIVLTNYANRVYRELCLAAGADYFFDKSAEFDRIPLMLARL
jgi:DNA-binding NarL/FixJ family response regulator